MVWDGSIHRFQAGSAPTSAPDGTSFRGLDEVSTRAADDAFDSSAFAQMGSQPPGSEADILDSNTRAAKSREPRARSRQYVASRGAGSVVADVIPERGETAAQIEVRRHDDMEAPPLARLHLKVKDRLGAVEFLEIDHSGRMFVFAENIPKAASGAAAFIARY